MRVICVKICKQEVAKSIQTLGNIQYGPLLSKRKYLNMRAVKVQISQDTHLL